MKEKNSFDQVAAVILVQILQKKCTQNDGLGDESFVERGRLFRRTSAPNPSMVLGYARPVQSDAAIGVPLFRPKAA